MTVDGEKLEIPERIYSTEPPLDRESALAVESREILACLYTRHHDGHVRQRRIGQVLPLTHGWVTPFVVRLIGEYVVEIVQEIQKALSDLDVPGSRQRAQISHVRRGEPRVL